MSSQERAQGGAAGDDAQAADGTNWDVAMDSSEEANAKALFADLERQRHNITQERNDLQSQLTQVRVELKSANEALAATRDLERQATGSKHELLLNQQRLGALEEEKKSVQERMDRVQAEADNLRAEISTLTESKQKLETSVADAQVLSQLKESQVIPLFHEKQRLQTELGSIQAHCTWLEQELQAKSTDYTRLRQESRDRAIQLQLQLDHMADEKAAAQARVEALQSMERALQQKVDQVSQDILQTRQELTNLKETTEQEVQEERRIVTLQKDQLDRWQHRYNGVVRENEGLKKAASEAIQSNEQELAKECQELERKYSAILKEQATDYETKLKARQEEEPRRLALPARSPGVTIPDEDGPPLSLTDLYTRLEETKEALREESSRRQLAEARFESVRKDIEEKAPIMNRQRREYDLAMDRLQEYHQRLEDVLAERDDAREDSREVRQEVAKLQHRLSDKKAESQELAKQVQALLVSRSGGQVAAGVPSSIEEMQNQNQRLLTEHRRLAKTVTELEEKLQTDTLKTKLERAEADVASLREDRKHQEVQVVQIVQQRDMYRALLKLENESLGSEGEHVTALELTKQQAERAKKLELKNRDLEDDFAGARSKIVGLERDSEVAGERLARYEMHQAELRSSNSKLQDELSTSRAKMAHSQNDSKYYSDKCERLEQSIESLRNEVQSLKDAKAKLDIINASLEERLSSADARAAHLEGEKQQADMKLRLAMTQAQTARASETRIAEESNQLRSELARQGAVVASVRRIEDSLSAKSEEEKEKLNRDIERSLQERSSDHAKHSVEVENLNGRIQEFEVRVQDIASKKERAQTEVLEAKKALLELQAEKQSYTTKISGLESKLRSAQKKLGESDDVEDVEATMQSRIETLTSELESAKAEVSALKDRAATYQKMAKESEASLVESTKAGEDFKAAHLKETDGFKAGIEATKKEIASKQEMVVELTNDLAGQRGEREKLQAQLQSQIASLEIQIANDKVDVESAKASAAALKLDVEDVRKEAVAALSNYERELALHSQARTSLRVALEEAQKEAGLRSAAEQQRDGMKNELTQQQSLWDDEKTAMQEASGVLEKSLAGSREQIALLHTQVEKLGDLVEKDQASRAVAAIEGGADTGDAHQNQNEFSELREVVKFLRSENEMVQSQLDSAKRKIDREHASASVARRSLDEARAELKALQDQQDSEGGNTKEAVVELNEKLRVGNEQLNLLRDSNKLLRDDSEKLRSAVTSTQKRVDTLKASSESAEQMKKEMGGKIAALGAEKLSLKKEVESWKDRVTSLVSKFNQIDPEEHTKALKESEALKKEIDSLTTWKKTTEQDSARIRTIATNLNKRVKDLRTDKENQAKEISKLKAEKTSIATASSEGSSATAKEQDEFKTKIAGLEKEFNAATTELKGANDRNDRLRERLRQFQTMIQGLKAKEKNLNAKLLTAETRIASGVATASAPPEAGEEMKSPAAPTATVQDAPAKKPVALKSAPSVPEGGFKFGPSKSAQAKEKQAVTSAPVPAKQASATGAAPLRPVATSFVPAAAKMSSTPTSPVPPVGAKKVPRSEPAKPSPSQPTAVKMDAKTTTEADSPKAPLRNAGEKAEMGMKEKLLEKKRKLVEAKARKRKMEEELAAKQTQAEEQPVKRAKPNEDSEPKEAVAKGSAAIARTKSSEAKEAPAPAAVPVEAEAVAEAPKETPKPSEPVEVSGDAQATPPVDADEDAAGGEEETNDDDDEEGVEVEDGTDEEEAVAEEEANGDDADDTAVVDEDAADDDEKDEEVEEEAPLVEPEETKKPAMPFGAASTTFGGAAAGPTTTFGAPASFGQGFGTPANTFGVASTSTPAAPSGFGSSFLNMKPPSSSTTAPTFSFGGSATIKLPIPAQQSTPAASPFGAFGSGTTSFGSFGGANTGSFGSGNVPLFGATAAVAAPEDQDESAPIEEEEDEMEEES